MGKQKKERQLSEFELQFEKRLKDASNTISFLNSGIVVLSIFIGVIGVGLPIITYQFGVKPSQEAVEKLEKTMDERISAYLETQRNDQINKAIDSLNAKMDINRFLAISYLGNQTFDREQVFKLIGALNRNYLQPEEKISVINSFVFQKSDIATEYFASLLKTGYGKPNTYLVNPAVVYFVVNEPNKYGIGILTECMKNSAGISGTWALYRDIIRESFNYNNKFVIDVLNAKELVDAIPRPDNVNDYVGLRNDIIVQLREHNIPEEEYTKTYFCVRFK